MRIRIYNKDTYLNMGLTYEERYGCLYCGGFAAIQPDMYDKIFVCVPYSVDDYIYYSIIKTDDGKRYRWNVMREHVEVLDD